MRVTYRDTSVEVNGRRVASLHGYKPSDARYASIPDGEGGWLVLVEAPEYWHSALLEVGFVATDTPEVLSWVEFIEVDDSGTY